MLSLSYLLTSFEEFEEIVTLENSSNGLDKDKECLVQIFTSILNQEDAVRLAKNIKKILPLAHVLGTSVCGVIYKGEQYDEATMITIEQYDRHSIRSGITQWIGNDVFKLVTEIKEVCKDTSPRLARVFFGGYYPCAMQFAGMMNQAMPDIYLGGGVSGSYDLETQVPFVFDENQVVVKGMVYNVINGEALTVFSRMNTGSEPITSVHTITSVADDVVVTIDHEPAAAWMRDNLGELNIKQDCEVCGELGMQDPLERFQLVIEGHGGAGRYVKYDEETDSIKQQYSRLEEGMGFKLSYSSPSRCLEYTKMIADEITRQPVEQIFVYSCLFRKLYLTKCTKREVLPYKDYGVCGVFLLGEFGRTSGKNELFHGSCVWNGIAEKEVYIKPDTEVFEYLTKSVYEDNGLIEFIEKRTKHLGNSTKRSILGRVIAHESTYKSYMFKDPYLGMDNIVRYEYDKKKIAFNKICMIKIENASLLINHMGQEAYYEFLKIYTNSAIRRIAEIEEGALSYSRYLIAFDTFVIAASNCVSNDEFVKHMRVLEGLGKAYIEAYVHDDTKPLLIPRYAVVLEQRHLLERAYSALRAEGSSQAQFIIKDGSTNEDATFKKELDIIELINYAIQNNKVIPYYQGIHNNKINKIDKFEALMRLEDAEGNIHLPSEFLDIAKKYRLYLELTRKMVARVVAEFEGSENRVSINISSMDVTSVETHEFLVDIIKNLKHPENLIFEILEDECFKDVDVLKSFIEEVRGYGVGIAIDDFGAGYSNLLELVKIRPDFIKIDGEIVKRIHQDEDNKLIVGSLCRMAQTVGIVIVAEFVENQEIQNQILEYNISNSQGYLFATPQPISAICL